MTRPQKVAVVVMAGLQPLLDSGEIEGPFKMTDRGMELYAELMASGFEPTEAEVRGYVDSLMKADLTELVKEIEEKKGL